MNDNPILSSFGWLGDHAQEVAIWSAGVIGSILLLLVFGCLVWRLRAESREAANEEVEITEVMPPVSTQPLMIIDEP